MAAPSRSTPVPPASHRRETMLVGLLLLAIGWSYFFAIPPGFRQLRASLPDGYYGLLTEAFLAGQLHLNIPTDPKLLTLENPYAGPQGANRPHDMSYYQGRFYLYYGAAPALFLYLPWRVLTGGYLGESLGMVMMLYGGVVLAAAWLVSLRRRWFPGLPIGWLLLAVAALGFGPPVFPSATNNTFYGVPIAGAFFCLMLAIVATDRALSARTPGGQAAWLGAASLAWGLAVGSRPIYVLGLIALAVPALYLWWTSGPALRWRWPGLRLLAATVVPAAMIGLAMMTYNYLRFDDPLDFGIRFSMASGDLREAKLVGPEFIGKNLSLYLLTTISLIRYYPFLVVDANTWGLLPYLPLAALGILFPLTLLHRPLRKASWGLTGVVLAGAGLGNFALLCLFFGGEERYMLDFSPPFLVLATATGFAGIAASRHWQTRWLARVFRLWFGLLLALALVVGLTLTLPRYDALRDHAGLARWLNTPAHWIEKLAGTPHGPLELEVIFPTGRTGMTEPLVVTGLGARGADGILVRYLDDTHVQFSAFHVGRGGPASEPIKIDYAAPHHLRITVGSLYPPATHPLFAGWSPAETARTRRRLKIELDGRTVLQGNFTVHPSVPSALRVGRSTLPPDVAAPGFTGRILRQSRLAVERDVAAGFENQAGPVRLTVRFPPRVGEEGLPLVATGGEAGRGDLLFARLEPDGRIRFGHDSFGAGAILSTPVPYHPDEDQLIEVEMGSLYPPDATAVSDFHRRRLRVVLNGVSVIDTSRPFSPSRPEDVEFGFNTIRASSAIEYFPGAIRKIERVPAHQPDETLRQWGHLRLAVELPSILAATAEPLVSTGRTGRADVLFVRYEPDGRVRFGLDHWGVGMALSDPVQLDSSRTLMLEIRSGALLPPKESAAWQGRDPAEAERLQNLFELRVNGQTVLVSPYVPYPNETGETAIGSNLIGASSCAQHFTGRFMLIERLPW